MNDKKYKNVKIFHHSSPHFAKQSNAGFLMGCFMMICLNRTAEQSWDTFSKIKKSLVSFRDAGEEPSDFDVTIYDCLRGLERGIAFGWYNFKNFDYKEYEFNHKLDNGDMNWVIPHKILAFSSPTDNRKEGLPPERFIDTFK